VNKKIMQFVRDEEGLTTVEYAIAGGLVGAGVIGAFQLLGGEVFRIIDAIYQLLATVTVS
jgi:pilus assembly protein Flp/PilA